IRFVNGILIPFSLAAADERIGQVTLPAGDSISGSSQADLRGVSVPKANVKHQEPVAVSNDLAACDSILLPFVFRVGFEDGVVLVLGPGQAVGAGGVANRVGLILFAS